MKGDELPVVTSKPVGRRKVKTILVIEKSSSNEFKPVNGKIYHEGYVGGKKFMVADSNLDAMANLVNLNMRRRISVKYKHQTSFDIDEDDTITKKLKKISTKFDSMCDGDEADNDSDGSDLLTTSESEWENIQIKDKTSLRSMLLEMVKTCGLMEADKYSVRENKGAMLYQKAVRVRSSRNTNEEVSRGINNVSDENIALKEGEKENATKNIHGVNPEGYPIKETSNKESIKDRWQKCKIGTKTKNKRESHFQESAKETETLLRKMFSINKTSETSKKNKNIRDNLRTNLNDIQLSESPLRVNQTNKISEYPKQRKKSVSLIKRLFSNISLSRTSVSENSSEPNHITKDAVNCSKKFEPRNEIESYDSILFRKLFAGVNISRQGIQDEENFYIKDQEVYLDIIVDDNHKNGRYGKLNGTDLKATYLSIKDRAYDTKRPVVFIDVEELDEFKGV